MLKIKIINGSEDQPIRFLSVTHSKGSFATPTYLVSAADLSKDVVSDEVVNGLVEVPIVVDGDMLIKREVSKSFERKINRYVRSVPDDALAIAVPRVVWRGRDLVVSGDEVRKYAEYLAAIAAPFNVDVVATPSFIIGKKYVSVKLFSKFLPDYLEAMTTTELKVATTIPIHRKAEIIDTILKIHNQYKSRMNNLLPNLILIDYIGSNPFEKQERYVSHRYIIKKIRDMEKDLNEPILACGINLKGDIIRGRRRETPAKDLTSYYIGLDSFGRFHTLFRGGRDEPKEVAKKKGLLSRRRYAYIRIGNLVTEPQLRNVVEAEIIKEAERILSTTSLKRSSAEVIDEVRSVNIPNIVKETKVLRGIITKAYKKVNPMDYLLSKEAVKTDENIVKTIKEFAKELKTREISEYG